ncbi:MAG: hypothetical protein ABW026_08800 [Microvirga sp.]
MTTRFIRLALAAVLTLAAGAGAPAFAQDAKEAKPAKTMSAAQTALRERQKACGAEWKAVKASGKAEAGMKWPKFWSACNTRMKADKKA